MIYKLKNNFNLRYLKKNDLNENYHSWFQNQITTEYSSHGKFSKSKKYYADQMIKLIDSKNNLTLAICKNNKHLGNVSLSSFSNFAIKISSEGKPQAVLIFFHFVLSKPSIL